MHDLSDKSALCNHQESLNTLDFSHNKSYFSPHIIFLKVYSLHVFSSIVNGTHTVSNYTNFLDAYNKPQKNLRFFKGRIIYQKERTNSY